MSSILETNPQQITYPADLEKALISCCRLQFMLSQAPANKADSYERIEHQVDEDDVLDDNEHFNRPDEHYHQDCLHFI